MALTSSRKKLGELEDKALASKSRGFSNIATPNAVIQQRATRNVEEIIGGVEQARAREAQQVINAQEFGVDYEETTDDRGTDDRGTIEKMLGLQQDQGTFGNFFELLNRPAQVIKGLGLDGWDGALKGISGQKVYTGTEVLEAVGVIDDDTPAFMKGIGSFLTEVALDPLTYGLNPIKWGASSITAGVKKGTNALANLSSNPTISGLAQKVLDATSDLSNSMKASFGIFKNKDYKSFKDANLGRQGHSHAATEQVAAMINDAQKDISKFVDDMIANPTLKEHADVMKELGVTSLSDRDQIYKALNEEIGRQVESSMQMTLPKNTVYEKLGEPLSATNQNGRFFVAAEGADPQSQASTIIDEIKKEYSAKYPGVELTDDQITWTPSKSGQGGFIDVDEGTAKFLRQEVKNTKDVVGRKQLTGVDGELEGMLMEMSSKGKITLDLNDPTDLQMLKLLRREFPNKVSANISGGRGTTSLTITPRELEKVLKSDDVAEALRSTKSFSTDAKSLAAKQKELEKLKQRKIVADNKFETSTQPIRQQVSTLNNDIGFEYNNIQDLEVRMSIEQGYLDDMAGYGKNAKNLSKAELRKQSSIHTKEIKRLQREINSATKKIATKEAQLDKKLALIQGRTAELDDIIKQSQTALNRKEKTIQSVVNNTDMNLGKTSTEADLLGELTKSPIDRITFGATGDRFKEEFQNYAALVRRNYEYNSKEFFRVHFTESTLMGVSEKFQHHVGVMDQVRQRMLNNGVAIHGEKFQSLIDGLNVDGYMRHMSNPDSIVHARMAELSKTGGMTSSEQTKLLRQLDRNKRSAAREWLGSAADINKSLGVELFNTNPLSAMAVDLQILPAQFQTANVFSTALESGMIRGMSPEELLAKDNILKQLIQDNPTANFKQLQDRAFKRSLPKEFTVITQNTQKELQESIAFMGRNSSPEEFQELNSQIQALWATDEAIGGSTAIMHKGVLNQIRQYGKQFGQGDLKPLTDFMDKYLVQPFKATATFSAGFTVRNVFTNTTNAYLAGIPMTKYLPAFTKATGSVRQIEGLIPKINQALIKAGKSSSSAINQADIIANALSKSDAKLWNQAQEWFANGLLGQTTYSQDINTILGKATGVFGNADNVVVNSMKKASAYSMRMNKITDQASKIAAFEFAKTTAGKKLVASLGMETPSQFAKFVFFDYADLTKFESQVMRTLVPFYTWGRKNAEFQIKNFIAQPGRYTRLNQAMNSWKGMFFDNKDEISQWDEESMNLPVWKKSDGTIVMAKFSPGFLDLESIRKQPLNKLNPVIKAPLEVMTGQNFFTGQEAQSNVFAQFSGTLIGDFGELGKAMANKEYDTMKEGLLTRKVRQTSDVLKAPFQNEEFSPEQVMPSFFRTTDPESNEIYNINDRVARSQDYLRALESQGAYRKVTPGIATYNKRKLTDYGGNF